MRYHILNSLSTAHAAMTEIAFIEADIHCSFTRG